LELTGGIWFIFNLLLLSIKCQLKSSLEVANTCSVFLFQNEVSHPVQSQLSLPEQHRLWGGKKLEWEVAKHNATLATSIHWRITF
jgi:hypothetical protein